MTTKSNIALTGLVIAGFVAMTAWRIYNIKEKVKTNASNAFTAAYINLAGSNLFTNHLPDNIEWMNDTVFLFGDLKVELGAREDGVIVWRKKE